MENSKISWTHHTWNPWQGCNKISDGCLNCYAEKLMTERFKVVEWGLHGARKRTSDGYWKQPVRWDAQASKSATRYRVFCGSLCDIFEDKADLEVWRLEAFDLMLATPHLDWLLLTKRPHKVLDLVPATWKKKSGWPANIHVGTSIEDQRSADRRMPWLMQIPSPVRFVSAEPLLEAIDMNGWLADWLIVGGESGHSPKDIRPMHPEWARGLRDWAAMNRIPFFMKQMGAWRDSDIPGADINAEVVDGRWFRWAGGHGDNEAIPEDLRIRQFPQRLELPF